MKKAFSIFPGLILLLCLCVFIAFKTLPAKTTTSAPQVVFQTSPPPAQEVINYTFQASESGKTALELTKENGAVEIKHYDFGDMVTGINGIKADNAHFWSLYVNGTMAETGASAVVLKKGDTINWKYETIQK